MTLQSMAKHIEHWLLSRLKPNQRNPRLHSDAQIAALAGSILAFGFNSPILVDSRGNIIAGVGRYRAALKLGLETVPVIVLDHLSETEKRAYLLADNKLAELSTFDDDLLRDVWNSVAGILAGSGCQPHRSPSSTMKFGRTRVAWQRRISRRQISTVC
jgi:ParB-like chromosome segregation protein Spo0J